ncbi:hypothetical protein SDC9_127160 [bioreactor metagenome]|uniref:Uncharacterized protein n=1 Tax=bioreactor metagenome TaxID=1076179 RepID=A0A645CT67_9ZZZZ
MTGDPAVAKRPFIIFADQTARIRSRRLPAKDRIGAPLEQWRHQIGHVFLAVRHRVGIVEKNDLALGLSHRKIEHRPGHVLAHRPGQHDAIRIQAPHHVRGTVQRLIVDVDQFQFPSRRKPLRPQPFERFFNGHDVVA